MASVHARLISLCLKFRVRNLPIWIHSHFYLAFNVSSTITNTTCVGTATGSIKAIVTGGNQPYTYQWHSADNDNGEVLSVDDNVTNLTAGSYYVIVNDSTGCRVRSDAAVRTLYGWHIVIYL